MACQDRHVWTVNLQMQGYKLQNCKNKNDVFAGLLQTCCVDDFTCILAAIQAKQGAKWLPKRATKFWEEMIWEGWVPCIVMEKAWKSCIKTVSHPDFLLQR